MIDLRAGLGAPPIVFPGVRMQHPALPSGTPGSAPLMPPGQAAQAGIGCPGFPAVAGARMAGLGIGSLQSWWDRIPLWARLAGSAVVFAGVSYGTYRLVR